MGQRWRLYQCISQTTTRIRYRSRASVQCNVAVDSWRAARVLSLRSVEFEVDATKNAHQIRRCTHHVYRYAFLVGFRSVDYIDILPEIDLLYVGRAQCHRHVIVNAHFVTKNK